MTSAGDVEGDMASAICAERALAPLFNVCRIQYASGPGGAGFVARG